MDCITTLILFHLLDAKRIFYKIVVKLATIYKSERRALIKREKYK